ncbi:MAG: endolytic transglycosylase MltG [Chitinophagaceae bacterium]
MANNRKKTKRKKGKGIRIGIILIAVLAFIAAGFFYFVFLSSSTKFNDDQVILLVTEKNANKQFIKKEIKQNLHSTHYTSFLALAEWTGYWKNIKPGRYIIKNGMGVFTIFRKLHNGSQDPIKIIITKIRTRKDLADYLGKKLEANSNEFYRFMNSNDSLSSLGLTKETVFTLLIPNTYEIYWNTNPRSFFNKMNKEANKFWNDRRLDNLQRLGLSKEEVITIASIVEEETNDNSEKPTIASVYLNRIKKGMALGADPTVKYAVGDFAIKRVTISHINKTASSPYNTYKNKGLPPGPICTPSVASIDAVLRGEKTDYLYFCAKADFSGSHSFAATAEEHFNNARKYRKALDSLGIR